MIYCYCGHTDKCDCGPIEGRPYKKYKPMRIINLNTEEGFKKLYFPDGQAHVDLGDPEEEYLFTVVCSINSPKKLVELGLVAEILNRNGYNWDLHIPYLMGARYDRVMNGDWASFDLKYFADQINRLKADVVYLFDPHSDVSPALINNSKVITNEKLVEAYNKEKAVLIIPDAGAAKKASKYFEWNNNLVDQVQCIKYRDLDTGELTLKVLEPEKCKGENCVIIDDLCDGGGTFNAIAEQIDPLSLTLIVTHGIFSKGFSELKKRFNQIITSDSYSNFYFDDIVKVIPYGPISEEGSLL